jgi:putative membrane protein
MNRKSVSGRHTSGEPVGGTPYASEHDADRIEPGPRFTGDLNPAQPDLAYPGQQPDLAQPGPTHPGPADLTDPVPPTTPPESHAVRRSRFGGLWVGLIVAALILVLLLVFILQNSQSVQIDFFGLSGRAPLAVAILLGVAAGALLVAIPGSVRIMQLRRAVKHDHERSRAQFR